MVMSIKIKSLIEEMLFKVIQVVIQVAQTITIDKFKHDWNSTLFKPSNDW